MKAITLDDTSSSKLNVREVPERPLKEGEVRVAIKAAALNHRDEWCRQGLYPNIQNGIILGSDGSGVVEEVSIGTEESWLGKEVIINPAINWGENQKAQNKDFEILGMPRNGTLAEKVIVPVDRLHLKPAHLTFEEAAGLPLAGLTAFRALFYQGEVKPGDAVLITGFGGGVAQLAFQYAVQANALVYATSSKKEKLDKASELGAKGVFNYTDPDWTSEALEQTGGFDIIIDSAAGDAINNLINVVKPGGRIVFYGATLGNPSEIIARKIFWNQIKLMGTTMGSDQDFQNMIQFVSENKVTPLIDEVFPFDKASDAFDKMKEGKQLGKIVLVP
ncbi:quinone oxidoreductase family protein [Algoriphagus machipongonensis]|uniref:Oxidoreductase, zinc-binding dehydrogenase family n=1 Tax=Algoriphagus machipongonensis TaxID=388413 RepID=A3HSA7_9BACT|nr:zinc-binding dehydrogenase [Algoriphagus machipongonensis]EAZ82725.1 oxidoreductase, zinc-binding dehydrogenase family [Algoriphagus machipongonensis]